MASFVEVQFPPRIARGATGGPGFSTDVVILESKSEKRNQNWAKARASWDVATGIKTPTDMDVVRAFFYTRAGKAFGFRFKDWGDYRATAEACGGTVGGGNTVFQLQKTYSSGGVNYVRPITKPVTASVKMFVGGVLKTLTADYTLNSTTGVVTFGVAPASAVTWTGEFDVPVRFDIDKLDITYETLSAQGILSNASRIPIIEL